MNILIIPSWYPNKKNPILGSFFREQALALARYGHNITVLNATIQPRHNYFSMDNFRLIKYRDENMFVYSYTVPSFGIHRIGDMFYRLFEKNMYKTFKQIIKDGQSFDIIHAHSILPAGMAACKLAKRNNIPIVVTEHSSGVLMKNVNAKERSFIKETINKAEKIICVSPALRKSILDLTGTKKEVLVIPNIVSPLFSFISASNQKEGFTFVSVATLNEGKRNELTIQAFCDAFRNMPNVKLNIIGDGPLMKKIQKLIIDLKMEKQIQLYGRLSREQTADIVKRSDAFVLASAYETFGIVYIEAMACGKPVLGTRNGGAEYIINASNGMLVDVDNVEQLSEAMKYIYDHIGNFDRKEIASDCLASYSGESIARELTNVYLDIMRSTNH